MAATNPLDRHMQPAKPAGRYPSDMFINRDLSWLSFNMRVLEEAANPAVPLLERLKFIAISGSNLDEFFMKRIGGIQRQQEAGVATRSRDGRTPAQQLEDITAAVRAMIKVQRDEFLNNILPALAAEGVRISSYAELTPEQRNIADDYYRRNLYSALTPLGVGPGHPFPFLSNQSLSLAVYLKLPGDESYHFARVKMPSNRPRFIRLGPDQCFIAIEELIAAHLVTLFPGATVVESAPFLITRDADVEQPEEDAANLANLISEELRDRKFAPVVRLVVNQSASAAMREYLRRQLDLAERDVFVVEGLLKLADTMSLVGQIDRPEMKFPAWAPVPHPRLRMVENEDSNSRSMFSIMRDGPFLVHHPYQGFNTSVQRLLDEAASDPRVVAIKQTVYRTGEDSPVIRALVRAAEQGKQVAVLVEIKARFDEANNLRWVNELERAGCHVTYGLVGLKTHTKVLMVVRDEDDGMKIYCHLGTGNYHPGNARAYTDLGYFVADHAVLGGNTFDDDVAQLFNMLTGYNAKPEFKQLLVAPVNMRARFMELIAAEAKAASEGKPARIVAKMNQLEDELIIEALYDASRAGVKIELIVRGLCCLRPGVPGTSENITVRSIVGRFLEHSRIFYFQNGGQYEYLLGSADWMRRNLDFRVETIVPIMDSNGRAELKAILDGALGDTTNSWELGQDNQYRRLKPGKTPYCFQAAMLERALSSLRMPEPRNQEDHFEGTKGWTSRVRGRSRRNQPPRG